MKPTPAQAEILSKATRTVQVYFPYFSTLVLRMEHAISDEVPTAGVYANGYTVWGSKFLEELEKTDGVPGVAWVMLHEMLHLAMKHGRTAEQLVAKGGYYTQVGNMAMDIAINQIIREAVSSASSTIWKIQEPSNAKPLYETTFGFPPNLRFVDYYNLLMKDGGKSKKHSPGDSSGEGCGDKPGEGCGDKPGEGCGDKPGEGCGDKPGEGCGVSSGKNGDTPSDCNGPSTPISEGELKVEVAHCARKARDGTSRNRGNTPAGIKLLVDEILEPAKVPWDEVLRNRLFHEIARGHGELVTYSYPNRKQGGLDYTFGPIAPRMPSTVGTRPNVGVLADTSGSMFGDLNKIVRETAAIITETGGGLTFAACDTEVHFCDTVSNFQDIRQALKGGGGTVMASGLDALAKKGCNPIICITDGYIERTYQPKNGAPVIWCIVSEYTEAVKHSEDEGWGHVIVCKD